MQSSTGRWVSGDNFFNRERELEVLQRKVYEHNHVLLTGQRRMGKTSVAQELGRLLKVKGWIFLFSNVEAATCAEDVIVEIARAVHPHRSILSRFATTTTNWFNSKVEEISALEFGLKFRAGLDAGNWRRYGERLFQDSTTQDKPVFLVIDELPIFLKRMLHKDGNAQRVDEFLSWLRWVCQALGDSSPVLMLSGSIGLEPLVRRIGIPDRINYLDPFRLGPWDRGTSVACFDLLAKSHELPVDDGVANAMYEALGVGIPHHVQSFFARLRDFVTMQERDRLMVEDVGHVYHNELLGPSGQNDLVHYETRLKDGLEDKSYPIAMEVLAEAATQDVFTPPARRCLERLYSRSMDDASGSIMEVIDVLIHDGYLEAAEDGHRFPSRLLKDWWSARFRDHHTPIQKRLPADGK